MDKADKSGRTGQMTLSDGAGKAHVNGIESKAKGKGKAKAKPADGSFGQDYGFGSAVDDDEAEQLY